MASVLLALGDRDAALDWLEEAYRERHPELQQVGVDPGFAPLHADPRFRDLLRRIGLPPPAGPGGVAEGGVVRPAIAVVPFEDLSPEGDEGYFSDGIAEELLNALGQISELRVLARTSSFAFSR